MPPGMLSDGLQFSSVRETWAGLYLYTERTLTEQSLLEEPCIYDVNDSSDNENSEDELEKDYQETEVALSSVSNCKAFRHSKVRQQAPGINKILEGTLIL